MTDTYAIDMHVVVPRDPAEVSIATASETLQLWHQCLGHQDKCHMRNMLEWKKINMSMAKTKASVMDVL